MILLRRAERGNRPSRDSKVNQQHVILSEFERFLAHLKEILVAPTSLHHAGFRMPVDSLQNVCNLMYQHMRK